MLALFLANRFVRKSLHVRGGRFDLHFGRLLLAPDDVLVRLALDALAVLPVRPVHLDQAAHHDDDEDGGERDEHDLRFFLLGRRIKVDRFVR